MAMVASSTRRDQIRNLRKERYSTKLSLKRATTDTCNCRQTCAYTGGTLVWRMKAEPCFSVDDIASEYDSCAHRHCWTAAASCPYYSCRRRYKPVGLVLPSVYCSRTRCCAIRFVDDESRALFFGGWYRSLFWSNFSNSSSVIASYFVLCLA